MSHALPDLPYAYDEPYISKQIKHHQTYRRPQRRPSSSTKAAPPLFTCHIDHSLFWKNLAPSAGTAACSARSRFNATTAGIQVSGWGWRGLNPTTKHLELATMPSQGPLLHLTTIIGVVIWEHAFYLQYLDVKVEFFFLAPPNVDQSDSKNLSLRFGLQIQVS
ncbi:manganese superoxide dismutase [Mycena rebaudengoi]|nr:manganese superoxide dismutase [Mycena rebaudengoi]